MINGAPDTSFGNAGTLWSSVPSPDKLRSMDKEQAITHVGGTAMGVHLVGLDEAPAIVASTWAMPDTGFDFTWRSSPSVLFFPVSGLNKILG